MMKRNVRPTARKVDIVVQETDSEILVYDLVTNKASCLNETAAFVWQNCNGSNAIADIAEALGRKTNSDVNDDLVWLAIDQLSKNKLLEEALSSDESLNGVSRREVIKKIGLGTMIALPIVASLVAPTSSHAASCLAIGVACNVSAQCCSACCKNVSPGVNQCKPGGGACLP